MKHSVKEVVLANGLKGLVLHIPNAPVVSMEISFRAGEFLLDRNKWETAHIMEHLMLGANGHFASSREFQAELEKNGAYSNASTSAYDVTYDVECAAFEAERIVSLVVGALQQPTFLPQEFNAEFGNVAEELVGRSNNHFRTLNLAIRVAQGLYGVPDLERRQLMKHVALQDIEAHYRQTHTIGNARFIIAGDDVTSSLTALQKLTFATAGKRLPMPEEIPQQISSPVIVHRDDVPNYYFYVDSYAAEQLTHEEQDALSVLSTILTDTLHSKLLGTAREKGLVYAMGSGQQQLKTRSSFWLGAQVSTNNAAALFTLIKDTLVACKQHGVSQAELTAAKMYIRGKHERSAQTATGTLAEYSSAYYFDDRIEYEHLFHARVEAVTIEAIRSVLQKVTQGVWTLGLLGNIQDQEALALYDTIRPIFE